MNVLLWIVQIVLALLSLAGGAYKAFAFQVDAAIPATAALSLGAWRAIGVFEIGCAVLLIVPAATNRMQKLTPVAAGALAIESLALAAMYARYSLELAATNPLVYVVPMAIMAAFVAYGRSHNSSASSG